MNGHSDRNGLTFVSFFALILSAFAPCLPTAMSLPPAVTDLSAWVPQISSALRRACDLGCRVFFLRSEAEVSLAEPKAHLGETLSFHFFLVKLLPLGVDIAFGRFQVI